MITSTRATRARRASALASSWILASTLVVGIAGQAGAESAPADPVDTESPLVDAGPESLTSVIDTLVSVTPARFADTRALGSTTDGLFAGHGKLLAGATYEVQIAGRGDVPADAVGAVINVTAVGAEADGYFTLHPCASPRPLASSLNYTAGVNLGNEIVASLDARGITCVYTDRPAHVTLDVVGYVPAGSDLVPILPARLLDTRAGQATVDGQFAGIGRTTAGSTVTVDVAGRGGVPADARTVVANVVAVKPTATGFVAAHACLDEPPATSSLNHVAGVNRGNEILIELGVDGDVCLFTERDVDLVLDVVGYLPEESTVATVTPARLSDSRPTGTTVDGVDVAYGKLAAATEHQVPVRGRAGVPDDATAVVVNVTAVAPEAVGFFTVHPCTDPPPLASSLNYVAGVSGGNEVIAGLSADGDLCVYSDASSHLVVDLIGYLANSAAPDADLSVAVVDDVDPVTEGDNVTYTVTVTNDGPGEAADVVLTNTIPDGTTLVATNGCANDPDAVPSCQIGNLAAGASVDITVEVTTDPASGNDSITHTAVASGLNSDPDLSNNTATQDTATLGRTADLSITKTDDVDPVFPGAVLTYTIDVANAGPDDGVNVVVTDTLPAGVTLISTTGCSEDPAGVATCSIGTIASGASAQITVAVTVDSGLAAGTITNSVAVASDTTDPVPANNAATEDTTVGFQNDAPSFTKGADENVAEDAGAQVVAGWATNISAGPPDEAGQTLTFNVTGNTNTALFSAGPSISPTGELTYTPAANTVGSATITVELMDDGGTADGGIDTSPSQTFVITVGPVNDPPSFTKGADETALEDAGAQTVSAWATSISAGPADESGQALTFNVTGNTNTALFSAGPAISPTGELTYTPAADANGTATITIELMDDGGTANGGDDTSATQTFDITVTAVNDEPAFTKGADQTAKFDAGAQTVTDWATSISAGPADESGQTLTFNVTNVSDATLFTVAPAVNPSGDLTFTPNSSLTANGTATITIELMDDGGTANGGDDTSATQTFDITITFDDPPTVTTTTPTAAATDVAVDTNITITFSELVDVTGDWVTVVCGSTTFNPTGSGGATMLAVTDADPTYTLDPAANLPGGSSCTVTVVAANVTDDDTNDPPSNMAANHVFGFSTAPVAVADSYTSIGNVGIAPNAAGGLILGSGADEGSGLTVSEVQGVSGGTGTARATAQGGSVNVATDGSFDYTPAAGFDGSDTFTYKVTAGGAESAAATVTITVTSAIWFVDNATTATGNDGTLANPFTTLAAFEAVNGGAGANDPEAGDDIYVATGSGSYTGGVTLETQQQLVGQGTPGTILGPILGFITPQFSKALPTVGGTKPVLTDPGNDVITLSTSLNAVSGLTIDGGADGIKGPATAANMTVGTVDMLNINGDGIDLTITSGVIDINDVDVATPGASGLALTNPGGTIDVDAASSITANVGSALKVTGGNATIAFAGDIVNSAGRSVEIASLTGGSLTFTGDIDDLGGSAGISITNSPTATTTFSGLLNLVTGTNDAFTLNNAGTVQVLNTTGTTITTTTGTAIDMVNAVAGLSGITFDSVTTAGAASGIEMTNVSGGTLTVSAGSIVGITSRGVDLDNVSSTVAIGASVANTNGNSVQVTGSSGSSTFSSAITESGEGIDLRNNSGSVSFTSTVDATNTTTPAVYFALNVGGSASFADLDIDNSTSNQPGVFATANGGTDQLTITTGTVNAGNSRAVDIDNTDLAVTLVSVNSSGGTVPGIDLQATTGTFSVTGTGTTAGSGGTIATKTGPNGATTDGLGVYLSSATNVTLNNMQMNDLGNYAIRGSSVNGFAMTGTVINGVNGNSTADDEGSVRFDNLTGTATITNSTIAGGLEDNLRVVNTTGTLNLDVIGGTIGLNSTASGLDGIYVGAQSGAVLNLDVSGTTFTGARGNMVACDAIGSSTLDCTLTDNSFDNTHPNVVSGGGGVSIIGGSNVSVTYDVSGTNAGDQTFSGAKGNAITVNGLVSGTFTGTIRNNHIGTATPGSGSTGGNGISVGASGTTEHTTTIDNNTIRGVDGFAGIDIAFDSNDTSTPPEMDVTVTNNNVSGLGGNAYSAFYSVAGGGGTSNGIVNLDLGNNVFNASGAASGSNAVTLEQFSGNAKFNLYNSGMGTGYVGSPNGEFAFACALGTATPAVNTFLVSAGNVMTNGAFPLFPGGGVDASLVCGMTGVAF